MQPAAAGATKLQAGRTQGARTRREQSAWLGDGDGAGADHGLAGRLDRAVHGRAAGPRSDEAVASGGRQRQRRDR